MWLTLADDDDVSEAFVHSVFKIKCNWLRLVDDDVSERNVGFTFKVRCNWLRLADDDDISEVFVHSIFMVNLITLDWLKTTFRNAMSVPLRGQL